MQICCGSIENGFSQKNISTKILSQNNNNKKHEQRNTTRKVKHDRKQNLLGCASAWAVAQHCTARVGGWRPVVAKLVSISTFVPLAVPSKQVYEGVMRLVKCDGLNATQWMRRALTSSGRQALPTHFARRLSCYSWKLVRRTFGLRLHRTTTASQFSESSSHWKHMPWIIWLLYNNSGLIN